MSFPTIGILGGMGPQATILLQERLLEAVTATDDADHIPLLIDMNPQVPSRIHWLIEGRGEDPAPILVAMAERLVAAGSQALAMPCNTAHAFAEEIEASSPVPFFNMPVLAAAKIVSQMKKADGPVGILASPATQRTQLFSRAFAPHGVEVIYPTDQNAMLETIKRIKSVGPGDRDLAALSRAADEMEQAGAQGLLVGCSEFSLLSHRLKAGVPVVDTLDVLVSELVDFACGPPSKSHS